MRDRLKQKQRQHESYLRNTEKYKSRCQIRRKERKKWYQEIMKDKSCKYCPENSIECLDWHHIDPSTKKSEVCKLLNQFRSFKSVLEEMNKCIVVCSNCHRKIHANTLEIGGGIEV